MHTTFSLVGNTSRLSATYNPVIELDPHYEYSLALIGFLTTNNIPNIEEGTNKFHYFKEGDSKEREIIFPKGAYEIDAIEQYIQNFLCPECTSDKERSKIFSLKPNLNTLKCELKSKYGVNFSHNDSIGKRLGYSSRKLPANTLHESDLPVNIIKVSTIRVECNIVTGSYYQSKRSHTIYETAITVNPGEQIFIEPTNQIYLPLTNKSFISNITLDIVDQDNNFIDFNGQEIVVRLALKSQKK